MKGAIYTILGAFMILIMSCDSAYYTKSYSFNDGMWTYDDPRSFNFEVTDTSKVYDMILTIDHTDQFPYQNLYLKTSTLFPSDTIIEQALSLEMANEAGIWFGKCTGVKCVLSIPIQSNVHFSEEGNYTLELEQYTRTDSLSGIIGINLILQIIE